MSNANTETKVQVGETESSLLDEIPPFSAIIPHRLFINNLDSYHGRILALFFSEQIAGALKMTSEEEEEEAEEEQEEEEEDQEKVSKPEEDEKHEKEEPHFYEIVGTAIDLESFNPPEEITELYYYGHKEILWEKLWSCGNIIYDITSDSNQVDEAQWALEKLDRAYESHKSRDEKEFKRSKDFRVFVLLSTVSTWALTKPIDPEDPDVPFTEGDYRKRRPHPNFQKHHQLEKELMQIAKKYKRRFKPIIVCTGCTYGGEEGIFHFLFKLAWHNAPVLPVFSHGTQRIPTIHIKDLCSVLLSIIEKPPAKLKYILAVEATSSTLKEIVKAISAALTTGKTKKITREEAAILDDMTQCYYDALTSNINMEPTFIAEEMDIKWHSDVGFVENINNMVTEYKDALQLRAIKIIIHGPPAVGKTLIANQLCKRYKLHYLQMKTLLEETLTSLREKKELKENPVKPEETKEEDEEEEDDKENLDEAVEWLEELERTLEENNGKLEDPQAVKLFKTKLMSHPCLNQGYVLDGFPETLEQATSLFEPAEEEEPEEEAEEGEPEFNKKIMPEFLFSLDAPDDFLCERVLGLPQEEVEGTPYSEENMIQRLTEFRTINNDETAVLNYFDEFEVHPTTINVKDDKSANMDETFNLIVEKVGPPRNYGPSTEEMREILRLEEEKRLLQEREEKQKVLELEEEIKEQQRKRAQRFATLMSIMQKEEEELIAANSIPIRNYLMRYVLPTITAGLLEVTEVRPDDPIDYLAEYLFINNPEGKMLEKHLAYQDLDDFGGMRNNYVVQALHEFQEFFEETASKKPNSSPESVSKSGDEVPAVSGDCGSKFKDKNVKDEHSEENKGN